MTVVALHKIINLVKVPLNDFCRPIVSIPIGSELWLGASTDRVWFAFSRDKINPGGLASLALIIHEKETTATLSVLNHA